MGTDFFEELGETLTKTAKELGERAEQIYETQKIRNKISAEKRITEKLKADIGNLIYRRFEKGEEIDPELRTLCEEIWQHLGRIREHREAAANIRKQKLCPSCDKEVAMEASFCPYCGAPCRTREADVVYEEEEEEAESVISENWEENFPEEAEEVKEPECEEEAEAPAAEPGCEEEAEASERPECTEEAAAPVAAAEAQEEPAGGSGAQEEACEPEETI